MLQGTISGNAEAGLVLYMNIDFLPKVNAPFHVTQTSQALAMHGEDEPNLYLLCVR